MKGGVNSVVCWEVEFMCDWVNLLDYCEGTNVFGT